MVQTSNSSFNIHPAKLLETFLFQVYLHKWKMFQQQNAEKGSKLLIKVFPSTFRAFQPDRLKLFKYLEVSGNMEQS